jgi:transposase
LTPKKWISQLKTGLKMSKKQSVLRREAQQLFYTEGFKQKIVNEVLSGKLNRCQAARIYGIKGNATITYWIRRSQALPGNAKAGIPLSNFAEMKKDIHDKKLLEENKELKELLRIAELRADLWQHAIQVAEQKLGIDILKKSGAQQLNPSKSKSRKKK